MYDDNNVFARIIKGQVSCDKVYEDDKVLAFYDICPSAPVHILVIPKGKYVDYSDFVSNAQESDIIHFFKKIYEIAKNTTNNKFKLITNQGAENGQTVFHFHVHIMSGKKTSDL